MKTLEAKILDPTHLELDEPIPAAAGSRIEISIRLDDDEDLPKAVEKQVASSTGDRASAPGLSGPCRTRELEWRRTHRKLLQSTYAGQWVVLEGEEIIAHGQGVAQLVDQARTQGIRVPYIFYVEESRPDVVRIGL